MVDEARCLALRPAGVMIAGMLYVDTSAERRAALLPLAAAGSSQSLRAGVPAASNAQLASMARSFMHACPLPSNDTIAS